MHRVHKAQHFLNAVRYYDNTRALVRAAAEYAVQLGNFLRTKGGGRFVQKEYGRIFKQRFSDCRPVQLRRIERLRFLGERQHDTVAGERRRNCVLSFLGRKKVGGDIFFGV